MLVRTMILFATAATSAALDSGGKADSEIEGKPQLAQDVQNAISKAVHDAVVAATPALVGAVVQETNKVNAAASAAKTANTQAIEAMAAKFEHDPNVAALVAKAKSETMSASDFTKKMLDALAESHAPVGGLPLSNGASLSASDIAVGQNGKTRQQAHIADALFVQGNSEIMQTLENGGAHGDKVARSIGYENASKALSKLREATDAYGGITLSQAAQACLKADKIAKSSRAANGSFLLGRDQTAMLSFSHSTSDFPELTSNLLNKTLLAAFANVQPIWRQIARKGNSPDFKERSIISLSDIGDLERIPDGGSVPNTTIRDRGERVALNTFARGVSITRSLLINDDLGGLVGVTQEFAKAAARTPDVLVTDLIKNNSVMRQDNTAFFHASHGNLAAAPAAMGFASLEAAVVAMRNRAAWQNGNVFQDIMPHTLVCPTTLGMLARKLLKSEFVFSGRTSANTDKEPNVLTGFFKGGVVDTPRLTGTGYYLFADPSVAPAIEANFLNGSEAPIISQIDTGSKLGMTFEVIFDCGVSWVLYEAAYCNAGA